TMSTERKDYKGCYKINHSATWDKRTAVLLMVLLTASWSFAQSSKLSKDLQSLPSSTSVSVVIQYNIPPTATNTNAAKSVGAVPAKGLGLIKGYGFSNMSPTAAAKLVSVDPNVKYISVDRKLKGAMNFAVPAVGADIALNLGYDGTGVGVAVIDSGVNPVADLSSGSRIVYSQNFDPSANTTSDLYGHGTHVAGIV